MLTRKIIGTAFSLAALSVLAAQVGQADPFVPTFEELAPGVWAGVREDNPRTPVMGTATFVISDAGVVVFDGGGSPLFAERIIEKIRNLTDKPITHVAISHWHGDHNFGIQPFVDAFPNVQVISHSFTHRVFNSKRIRYIDNYATSTLPYKATLQERLKTNKQENGEPLTSAHRKYYERLVADADIIHEDSQHVKVPEPTITFDEKLTVRSGDRTIEFLYLGDGNTAGDIMMWLPDEKIVAAGDTVVHPIPYLFNVPPRRWAQTMRNINALDYEILVPGHGDIQHDKNYVNLLIDFSDDIANQRDKLLAEGLSEEDAKERLDFSTFEKRFVGDDDYLALFFDAWSKQPFRDAVFKALKNEPMVEIIPE